MLTTLCQWEGLGPVAKNHSIMKRAREMLKNLFDHGAGIANTHGIPIIPIEKFMGSLQIGRRKEEERIVHLKCDYQTKSSSKDGMLFSCYIVLRHDDHSLLLPVIRNTGKGPGDGILFDVVFCGQ
ncbi:unnamed protein product [Sphenostylis stenocarpa]|uniref:Uncharacterized protein n=1 Tax=Sphenostylis stenocarpa TaxID=92480 RepID=A0AA86RS95_9FABA|nr:unnamed protein product [Sphenostylis stenocarpa]